MINIYEYTYTIHHCICKWPQWLAELSIVCTTDGMIEITFVFNALLSLGLIIINYLGTYIELLMKWVVPFIRKKGRPRGVVHNIFWQIMLSKWRLYSQKKYKYYIAGKIIRLDQDKCKANKNKLLLIITYNSTKWKSFIHWQVEE